MTIGEKIKQKRIELNMSQDELAKKVGYKSRSSIQKIESARNLPLDKVEVMASALDCTPAYLMGWEDEDGNIKVETATVPKSGLTFEELSEAEFLYKLYANAKPEIRSAVDLLLRSQNQQENGVPHLVAEKPRAEVPHLKKNKD